MFGGMPEWPKGADCKSAGLCLRWFESTSLHNSNSDRRFIFRLGDDASTKLSWYSFPTRSPSEIDIEECGCSSAGRAPAFQAGCRGFESLRPLESPGEVTGDPAEKSALLAQWQCRS